MWKEVVWLGKADASDEHLGGDAQGVRRFRCIRRQPTSARWRRDAVLGVVGAPWQLRPPGGRALRVDEFGMQDGAARASAAPPLASGDQAAGATTAGGAPLMEVPTQPAGRAKRMYVTEGLVAEFGRTPGCPRCEGGTQAHSERCRQRISQILSDRGRAAPVADETAPMSLEVHNNPTKTPNSAAEQAPTQALAQEAARSSADATMARSVESREADRRQEATTPSRRASGRAP